MVNVRALTIVLANATAIAPVKQRAANAIALRTRFVAGMQNHESPSRMA